jgi:hypothetical protein
MTPVRDVSYGTHNYWAEPTHQHIAFPLGLRLRVLTSGVLRPGVAGEVGVFVLSATPTTATTEPPQTHTRRPNNNPQDAQQPQEQQQLNPTETTLCYPSPAETAGRRRHHGARSRPFLSEHASADAFTCAPRSVPPSTLLVGKSRDRFIAAPIAHGHRTRRNLERAIMTLVIKLIIILGLVRIYCICPTL